MNENELAIWVEEQKRAYRRGMLSKEQINKLESIPHWTWQTGVGLHDRR